MTNKQMRARDLRRVCLHEFAHLHVARHHGVAGHVRVAANPHAGDGLTERMFIGKFHFLQRCEDASALRQIGLAGTVAEELDDDTTLEGWQILEWLQEGTLELSGTDAKYAGDYTEADLDLTIALVRDLWDALDSDAELEVSCWASEAVS
jgi:hypothetical protein